MDITITEIMLHLSAKTYSILLSHMNNNGSYK